MVNRIDLWYVNINFHQNVIQQVVSIGHICNIFQNAI